MEDKLLWVARVRVDSDGLEHTEIYDCETGEYSEEWHPVDEEVKNKSD